METRIVCTEIWRNPDFRKLDHASKIIILFLLSNDKIPVLPVYQIPLDEICFYCNVTDKKLNEVLQIISKFGIYYIDEFFIIEDKFTRAKYTGGKTEKKRERLYQALPSSIKELLDYEGNIGQSLGNHWPTIGHINHKPEIINKKTENIKHEKYGKREDITNEVLVELATKYNCSVKFVEDCWDSAMNWLDANGQKKNNYKAFLSNWIKKELANQSSKKPSQGQYAKIDNKTNWESSLNATKSIGNMYEEHFKKVKEERLKNETKT